MNADARRLVTGVALMLAPLSGCGLPAEDRGIPVSQARVDERREPVSRICFRDATAASGVAFVHQQGRHLLHLPEVMSPGAAVLDYDGDGLLDLFLVQGSGRENGRGGGPIPSSMLYRNAGDGRFVEVAGPAHVPLERFGMGCLAADLDNDGLPDLVVTAYHQPNALFLNNADGTFREVARDLGVQGDSRWNSFVIALDYDRDGLLDLYAGRYSAFGAKDWIGSPADIRMKEFSDETMPATMVPDEYPPQDKTLYQSRLPAPYRDVTGTAGVADADGRGMGAVGTDLDEDGWPDLFVTNDASPCGVYRNAGDGRFEDIRRSSWGAEVRGSMGIALSDYKGDGTMALLVTHFTDDIPALYAKRLRQADAKRLRQADAKRLRQADAKRLRRAGGRASLVLLDRGEAVGLGAPGNEQVGWGCGFFDLDQDGWEDLLIINGHANYARQGPRGVLAPQGALLFANDGNGHFSRISPCSVDDPLARRRVGRGAAFGDLDRDGSVDVVVCTNNGPAEVWKSGPPARNWIVLELVGTRSGRDAIGARVELVGGPRRQVRELVCGESYFSSNARHLMFGLGQHRGPVVATVRWPSGIVETFGGLARNRFVRLAEGSGQSPRWP